MYDSELRLKDSGAVTSSGYGTVDATAKVVDLGNGLVRGNLVVDISAIDVSAGNEAYTLHLIGGSDADFTEEVSLASKELGSNGALEGSLDSAISRVVIPFQNEDRGVIYPYVRIRHVISGTGPSINYTARLEKDLPYIGATYLSPEIVATTTTTV